MNEQDYRHTVLVVDDIPASMEILVEGLIQANFRVLIAESGQEALQILQHAAKQAALPDVILVDVFMPGIDGFEACRQIKAMSNVKDIPVLFVTAHNESVDIVRGFDVGGADYIAKPIRLAEVLARLNTHLTMYRLRKRLLLQNNALSQELQRQVVRLEVEAESRKKTIQEMERLVEERDQLLDVVRSQSEQLGALTTTALASQNKPQQSMLYMLGQQMQDKLSTLREHLHVVYEELNDVDESSIAERRRGIDSQPIAIEHVEASMTIIEKAAEQAERLLTHLESQTALEHGQKINLSLSTREQEVLQLIAKGQDNAQIAAALCVEPTTVRTHRARIMTKLDVKNSYELMRIALLYDFHSEN